MDGHAGHNRERGPLESLRDEFRQHLDVFYSRLKLAAPYDSVEKALGRLTSDLKTLSPKELEHLSSDSSRRWMHFRQAFVESGLNQKHRGIIAGLARSRQSLNLPREFDHLLDLYKTSP
ncbi:MAG: hypothetical protein K0S45_1074 [Nitrospira sp.]|nr:hypothetical protein [Nitrospira sp.]